MLCLSPSYSTAINSLLLFCERYHVNRIHFMDLPSLTHRHHSYSTNDQSFIPAVSTALCPKELPLCYCMVLHPCLDSPTYSLCCDTKDSAHGVIEVNRALLESILEGFFGASVGACAANSTNNTRQFSYKAIRKEIWKRLLVHHPELFKEPTGAEIDGVNSLSAFSLSTPFFLLIIDGGAGSENDMLNASNMAEHTLISIHEYIGCLQRSIDIYSLFKMEKSSENLVQPLLLHVSTEVTGEMTSDNKNLLGAASKSTKYAGQFVSAVALLNCELPPIALALPQYRQLFTSGGRDDVSVSVVCTQTPQQYPDIPILAVVLSSEGKLLVPHDQGHCLALLCTVLTSYLTVFVDLGNLQAAAGGTTSTSATESKSTTPGAHLIANVLEGICKEFDGVCLWADLERVCTGLINAILSGDSLPPVKASQQQVQCMDRVSLQGQEGFPVLIPFWNTPVSEPYSTSSPLRNVLLVIDISSDVINEASKLSLSNSENIVSLFVRTLRDAIEMANAAMGNIASENIFLQQRCPQHKGESNSIGLGEDTLSNPIQVYGPHLSSSIAAIVMDSPNEQFRNDVLTMLGIQQTLHGVTSEGYTNTKINASKRTPLQQKRELEGAILQLITEAIRCNK